MNQIDAKAITESVIAGVAPDVAAKGIDESMRLREDLDLDSLDFLDIVDGVQHRTGVDIPESDYAKIRTVGDLTAYLSGSPVQAT